MLPPSMAGEQSYLWGKRLINFPPHEFSSLLLLMTQQQRQQQLKRATGSKQNFNGYTHSPFPPSSPCLSLSPENIFFDAITMESPFPAEHSTILLEPLNPLIGESRIVDRQIFEVLKL